MLLYTLGFFTLTSVELSDWQTTDVPEIIYFCEI